MLTQIPRDNSRTFQQKVFSYQVTKNEKGQLFLYSVCKINTKKIVYSGFLPFLIYHSPLCRIIPDIDTDITLSSTIKTLKKHYFEYGQNPALTFIQLEIYIQK